MSTTCTPNSQSPRQTATRAISTGFTIALGYTIIILKWTAIFTISMVLTFNVFVPPSLKNYHIQNLRPSLFTGWAQHCVFVRCCVCSEHFNNSIWQCPQVKDMPRTPQTRSMSFSDLWEFSLWRAFVNTFLVVLGWLGLDLGFKRVICWLLQADRPEFNQNRVHFLQKV